MLAAPCPNCGAELRFRSTALPAKICDYCHSLVVRTGESLAAAGTVATVPDDVSPLQIGTRGRFDDRGFELIGRIRWRWRDGGWNEWVMFFDDGSQGWLGDAMGRLMVLFDQPVIDRGNKLLGRLRSGKAIVPGRKTMFAGTDYRVGDVRRVECVGSEGELPFPTPPGLAMTSVDLSSPTGQCGSVQREDRSDGAEVAIYLGRYTSLGELAPSGLRSIEGWAMPIFGA